MRDLKGFKWKGLLTLFFFLIATFVFYQFQGGFVSGFLFYTVLTISILEAILLLGTMGPVRIKRRMSHKVLTAGQHLGIDIEIRFKSFLPLVWFSIEDQLPGSLESHMEPISFWQMGSFHRAYTMRYKIKRIPRGEHQFGYITVHVGDMFGFFQRTYKEHVPATTLVYPSYQELRFLRSINEKNTGMSFSLNRNAEDVTSVMGIRNYVSGDRLSRIHWRASARTGQLKTKEFEYHVTNDFMFFVDCQRRVYQQQQSLFERSISLAATLIRYALSNHFTAGLSMYREEEIVVPLARHQEQLVRLFVQLARAQADSTYSFAKHLIKQVAYIPFGTTAMVITARIDDELIKALSIMRMKKISVELFCVINHFGEERELLGQLTRDGITLHIIDSDDLVESLKGVSSSGQVS